LQVFRQKYDGEKREQGQFISAKTSGQMEAEKSFSGSHDFDRF
jgi:hypothetical protein